ncbi:MAG: hypothetical protein CSB55_08685 [Candidatus Cloacimonadota bacterium]|nr:MAG: hypothetical protein CSB55_08685 [Candidatus Cloacimonadota bacterium]
MDFSFKSYKLLLNSILKSERKIIPQKEFKASLDNIVLLRHDVDRNPINALKMAETEHDSGIKATYYFRIVNESFNPEIIVKIADLGHEIGYHYEDLSLSNGDYGRAIELFEKNLKKIREYYPVESMCMHGSPMSKYDNRDLWKKYDYKKYGIKFEPYFDMDFNKMFYITDAGRSWNNEKVSVRDKVKSCFNINIYSTENIINLLNTDDSPEQIMISTHPHNWAKNNLEWLKIFLWQSFKNTAKRILIISKK